MNSIGTSLDEAFAMEGQIDPQYALEGINYDLFDPQEMMNTNKRKDDVFQMQQQPQIQQQPQQPQQQMQQQMQQQSQQQQQSQPQIQQQIPIISNPVTQYPPYEYDSKTLQQELQQQNQLNKKIQLNHAKDINQGRNKKSEHFSSDKIEYKKKGDMYKSILFTLMILLAIATHYFIDHIYVHFVTAPGTYSLREEVGFRLLYPLIIFIIIWFAKS